VSSTGASITPAAVRSLTYLRRQAQIVTPRFELAGRAAIAQWFAARAQRTTRHRWSNLRLTRARAAASAVDAYLSTAAAPTSAASAAAEVMISETHDMVVRDEQGAWQFAARNLSVVFEDGSALRSSTRHETATFRRDGRLALGIVTEDGLIDVERADASLPRTAASLLEAGPMRS